MQLSRQQKVSLWVILFILLLFSIYLYWNFFSVEDIIVYQMDAYIAEPANAGFNLDPDKLHFGQIANTSPYAYREVIFTNPYNASAKVRLHTTGNMSGYISYQYHGATYADPFTFTLEEDERVPLKVVFSFNSSDVEVGQYFTGELYIISRKTLF